MSADDGIHRRRHGTVRGASPAVPGSAQALIGLKLRRLYADVLHEDIPERLTALLEQLKGAERGR